METGDLLAVADWLQAKSEVSRTGLIGFCWGANHALLAAWAEGRGENHPSVSLREREHIRPWTGRRYFEAGVVAFSPCLSFENIIDQCDEREWSPLVNPVLFTLQDGIRFRMELKRHPEVSGSLRKLIDFEFARSELSYPEAVEEGLACLRFLPYRGKPDGDKLESARMPVLIVHGANDPLAPAQDVATLIAQTENRRVAALVLPDGGHVGFAAYSRPYFYSLILNFFDPERGANPL
jgi:predicted alpha/beta-fold hydrolase